MKCIHPPAYLYYMVMSTWGIRLYTYQVPSIPLLRRIVYMMYDLSIITSMNKLAILLIVLILIIVLVNTNRYRNITKVWMKYYLIKYYTKYLSMSGQSGVTKGRFSVLNGYYCVFCHLQECAAWWASTLITHKHSAKHEKADPRGTQNKVEVPGHLVSTHGSQFVAAISCRREFHFSRSTAIPRGSSN